MTWLKGVGIFLGVIVIALLLDLGGLHWMKFIGPKRENVRREIFEETKSYTQGKIQDLAKYYEEHLKAETQESKDAIEGLIKMQFAEFDTEKIKNSKLKLFLTNVRGF